MKDNNKKDAYWFSHDSNAKDDPKCVLLIDQLGLEGYGIYWVLVEILREQPDFSYPLALVPAIAKRYGTTAPKVETVIKGFGLFGVRDEKFFYSPSLISRVLSFKEKQDRKSAASIKANMARWEAERERKRLSESSSGVPTESEQNPNGVRTESDFIPRKEKKIKEKENCNSSSKDSELSPTPSESDEEALNLSSDSPESPKEKDILSNKQCQQVLDFWNRSVKEHGAQFSEVKLLSEKRKAKIRTRWKEFTTLGNPVEVCRRIVENACTSKFLQGDNPRGWKANFDWIFETERNWARVYEGNYNNTSPAQGKPSLDDLYAEQIMKIKSRNNGQQSRYPDIPEEQ